MPMLLEYAEEHHVLVYAGGSTKPPSHSGDSDVESVHWGDTDEEDEQEEDEKYVEKLSSAHCALYAMAIEAGLDMRHIPNHRQPFRVRCALHDPHKLVICIYSNYELAYIISDAAIAKMQKRLGIQEALVWYVCSLDPGRRGVGLLLGGNYSVRNHALLVPRTVIRRWSVSPIGTDSNGRVYQHARHFLFGLVVDSVSIVVEVVNIYDMATVVVLPCT